jgi:ATP-binding cassette subfamily B protein
MNEYNSLPAFVLKFIKPFKWGFLTIFFSSLVWALEATLWPYLFQIIIDILAANDTERLSVWPSLATPLIFGLSLWIGIDLGYRIQGFVLAAVIPRMEANIRMTMFDHIQQHSPNYFNNRLAGELANKISDMTFHVSSVLQLILTTVIPGICALFLSIVFFANINSFFSYVLTGWLSLYLFTCLLFTKKCTFYENSYGSARSLLLGKIVDSLTNNFAVNLFHRFHFEKGIIAPFQKDERAKNKTAKQYVEMMRLVLSLITVLLGGIGINGFMFYYWMNNLITTGEVVQIFNTTLNLALILTVINNSLPLLFQSLGISKQALTVMNDPKDVLDPLDAKPLVVTKGEIVFDKVSFQYEKNRIFQNKDVRIRGGEKVGLVGYSGGGKSTFIGLILRFYGVEKGRILIDNQDLSKITLESLRKQVALIPQDPILFHRTLKENILYGRPNATDEEVFRAAEFAHCDKFIKKFPDGYNTYVGERGSKLSGGERQRIAIARALLSNAPILILDEATSALDSVTERYIQDSLKKLMKNRTSIVAAHRLATLSQMDRILVFEKGRIVEEGTHTSLMTLNGHYAKLWDMQACGLLPEIPQRIKPAQLLIEKLPEKSPEKLPPL